MESKSGVKRLKKRSISTNEKLLITVIICNAVTSTTFLGILLWLTLQENILD